MITEETARKQLEALHQEGVALAKSFAKEEEAEEFEVAYQRWYSRSLPLMKALALDRYAEFQRYYIVDPRYSWYDTGAFIIQDYFRERDSEEDSEVRQKVVRSFTSQLALLKSVSDRLAWSQMDTADQAARGLQLAALESARDLIRISERAAGALAGTVLQSFLSTLASKHQLKFRKNSPTSRDYAEALKTANALDVPVWSQCTWLIEIHDRVTAREGGNADFAGAKICPRPDGEAPTKLQVRDLIDGTHWLITNVF